MFHVKLIYPKYIQILVLAKIINYNLSIYYRRIMSSTEKKCSSVKLLFSTKFITIKTFTKVNLTR